MSIINIWRNRGNIMNRWSFVIVLIRWYFVADKPLWFTLQSDYDSKLWESHLHFNNALKCNIMKNMWICNMLVKKCGWLCFNVIKCGLYFWNIPYLKKDTFFSSVNCTCLNDKLVTKILTLFHELSDESVVYNDS